MKIEHVQGPHKHGPKYRLRWTADGTPRSKSGSRSQLLELRAELLGEEQSTRRPIKRLPTFGKADFFRAAMTAAEKSLRDAFNQGDERGLPCVPTIMRHLPDPKIV